MTISATTILETEFGPFTVACHNVTGKLHISLVHGDMSAQVPVIRLHSSCIFGEVFHSLHCDCHRQFTAAMRVIHHYGSGAIVYSQQEGRGIGIERKIVAMEIQRTTGCDTVEAFKKLGYDDPDPRNYKGELMVLAELAVPKNIHFFSSNPRKRKALEQAGYVIWHQYDIPMCDLSEIAKKERAVKMEKMGHVPNLHGE